jgi:threonine synthase
MALSILPNLLKYSKKYLKEKNKTVILTATSGDTGKAALEGFANIENVEIIVFYPKDGVSPIQRKQMLTQKGKNVNVFGIEGNFDDAQSAVKNLFNDKAFNNTLHQNNCGFSSANSINIGRLLPQIVYYVSSYFELVKQNQISFGEKVNFVVPTGNFGNILAGKYAKEIGLPIKNFICASNENNILTDFINTGLYDLDRNFIKTISPSMDILISSNLERLLFYLTNNDANQVNALMSDLKENKKYSINSSMKKRMDDFKGYFATEKETKETIKEVFDKYNYLMDPHTAVAYNAYNKYLSETGDQIKTLILSTASPFKFPKSVAEAIGINEELADFDLLNAISEQTNTSIPENIKALKNKEEIHNKNIKISDMEENILKILNI